MFCKVNLTTSQKVSMTSKIWLIGPVCRCLHIRTVVDAKEKPENYCRKQRKKQSRLALQPSTNTVRFAIV
jgi:hypothetical protein